MKNRIDRLNGRRTDPDVSTAKLHNEFYTGLEESESVRYVVGSMQPIDPDYTANTYAEGDRVKSQLHNNLDESCVFRYQGSVTNEHAYKGPKRH